MKFTKLQYEKYKNFKNNKLNIVDDDFFGYSRYKYTSNKYENSIQNVLN